MQTIIVNVSQLKLKKHVLFLFILLTVLTRGLSSQEIRWFNFSDFNGALTLQYQLTDEEEGGLDYLSRDLNRKFTSAGIQLNTSGSVYHPNFLTFRADVNIIGHRTKNRFFSDPSVNNDVNNTYNINLAFLRKKKLSFDLFTMSNFSSGDRAFIERYFSTFKSSGFKLRTRTKFLPFQLDIYNTRMKSESLTYTERDEKSENIDFYTNLLTRGKSRLNLTIRGKNYSEAVYDVDYKSLEFLANFSRHYGTDKNNILSSVLTYNRMTGDYDFDVFRFRTNALHYLSRNLSLIANYTLVGDNSYDRSHKKHELSGELKHQLFESLTSSLKIGGRLEDSLFQDINAFFNQLFINYRKKIPTGSIQLQLVYKLENGRYSSREDISFETQYFDFSYNDTIVLTWPGIRIVSIKVTDPGLSHIYVLDIDYQVNVLNDMVTITRLPGGAIPAGAKVRVYFEYLTYPDFHLESRFFNFNFRLNFLKYFQLFYRKYSNTQNITSDYLIPPFNDYDRNALGARFSSRYLNVMYTREKYESSLSDYFLKSFRASVHASLFRRFRLSLNLNINRIEYEPGIFYVHFDSYSADFTFRLLRGMNLDAIYRKMRYTTPAYDRDRESILFKYNWSFRKIMLSVYYEHFLTRYIADEMKHDYFSVMLRRFL